MDNNQSVEIPQEIRSFLESLIQDAKMILDEGMKEEMIKELYARLDSFITTSIIDNLPPENLEEFIKINEEKKSQSEIEQFLKDKMPNAQDVFAKAFADFRALYLGNVAAAKNAPSANSTSAAGPSNDQGN